MVFASTAVLVTLLTLAQPAPDAPANAPGSAPGSPPARSAEGERARQPGERRQISVEATMKIMDRAMEPLNGQISDPAKRDENLAYVNEMQRGCVIGKGLSLPKEMLAKAGDEAAQAKIKEAYRAHMFALLKKLVSLEEALVERKFDQAKKLLDEVAQERDRGHEATQVPDDAVSPFYPK